MAKIRSSMRAWNASRPSTPWNAHVLQQAKRYGFLTSTQWRKDLATAFSRSRAKYRHGYIGGTPKIRAKFRSKLATANRTARQRAQSKINGAKNRGKGSGRKVGSLKSRNLMRIKGHGNRLFDRYNPND